MVELFEQDRKTENRQSSKGNQLKWENNNIWYKADYTGYESLSEYIISHLLAFSNLKKDEYVLYDLEEIKYKNQIINGSKSNNFLKDGYKIITLERLFQGYYGKSLHESLWLITEPSERLKFLVESIERVTGLSKFGQYMNKLLTIDMMFLNEDRHTHNIAVLMNEKNEFLYCPIFDNGAGLLADTTLDYPLNMDIYKLIDSVESKTFSTNFEEQVEVSEKLYGSNIKFSFTKEDVDKLLSNEETSIYPLEIKERVRKVIFEQMRRYPYLF